MLKKHGERLTFLDGSYGLVRHGYCLVAAAVRDNSGVGVPVGFLITESESEPALKEFVGRLQEVRVAVQVGWVV